MKSSKKRKKASEKILKSLRVPINKHLPIIVDEAAVSLRTKEEIINRIIPLSIAAAKAMEAPPEKIEDFIEKYHANGLFTKEEQKFLSTNPIIENERIQYSWKLECIWLLLWSVNLISDLDAPAGTCDADFVFETVLLSSKQELLEKSAIKPVGEILDILDFTYRAHWAVREAQLNDWVTPSSLEAGVVYERHYTLNWLVNYMEEEWDDVSTST
ncbi:MULTISPECIES: DUF4272 domain-containing protein [Peribacillus]|uniref:DUF4272 domain-containing protein n=1 Tax=Peribacillus simplex TaxID=1478 RepID=A0A109MXQ4_9BACI|nr:DUF4272 domain-containing protein [Peribacillus simplex]KWW18025.1 hypothetical protein AS888_06965 [Peribacillus simplex]